MKTQCEERGGRRLYRRPLHITVEKSTHHSYDILTEESTSVIEDGTFASSGIFDFSFISSQLTNGDYISLIFDVNNNPTLFPSRSPNLPTICSTQAPT